MKIIKAVKKDKDISVKTLIHQRVPGMEPARSTQILHASELTKEGKEFCPREYALLAVTKKKGKPQFIGTAMRITFQHGNNMQSNLNNDWMPDVMVGDWRCQSCDDKEYFCKKPKGHCGRNGINCNWEYEESRFECQYTGASCGVDAMINTGEPKLRLVEVKSMDKDQFKKLLAPLAEHRERTNLYLRLIENSLDPNAKKLNTQIAHVLYVSKSFGFKDTEIVEKKGVKDAAMSPFKEFFVKRNDTLTDDIFNKAVTLKTFKTKKKGMPMGICSSAHNNRAKQCPVIKECWSGKYPGKVTWVEGGKKRHNNGTLL